MKLLLILSLCVPTWIGAFGATRMEPEPDWTNRYRQVRQELLASFKPPPVGQTITIIRRIGGEYTGRLDVLSSDSVVVGGMTWESRQLTDETCDKLFSGFYASRQARQRVQSEREAFRERRVDEISKTAGEAVGTARRADKKRAEEADSASASFVAAEASIPPSESNQPNGRSPSSGATTAEPPTQTLAVEGDSLTRIFLVSGLLIAAIIGFASIAAARRRAREEARREALISEATTFVAAIRRRKGLIPISTQILLKKGEDAFLEGHCSLNETRAVRHYQSGGLGFRIAKGVYVGGSRGVSVSVSQMTRLDTGALVLTNKRLIFDGSTDDRAITLDKIVSVNTSIDALEVSTEGRQKSMYFTVSNPLVWWAAIRILSSGADPKDLNGVDIDLQFN